MHLFVIHTKLKMLSSFTLPQVVPNLNEFLFFLLNTKEDILNVTSIYFLTMEVNGYGQPSDYQHSSKYLLLCSAEERN